MREHKFPGFEQKPQITAEWLDKKMLAVMRREQRIRVMSLFDRLSQEENRDKINYELMLVKRVISISPLQREDRIYKDQNGNIIYSIYTEFDPGFYTFTQNGFDEDDKLASRALPKLNNGLAGLSEDDEGDDGLEMRGTFDSTDLLNFTPRETTDLIKPTSIIIRAINGHPQNRGRKLIATAVINFEDTESDENFMLGHLKAEINNYASTILF